jgi:ribosomal-protein-alanine N-acetyltransferase
MFPISVTGRLVVLREFQPEDVAAVYAVVGDDRVTRWLSFDSRDVAAAATMVEGAMQRARQQPRTEYYLAIATPPSSALVGFVRLALDGMKAGKLGYAIAADQWRRGFASPKLLVI